jgi:UDP-N-acetyl-D-mannosaminuronate dehydrogenase
MRIGILGYGEVGKAISSFYTNYLVQDLDRQELISVKDLDILHVCIPFTQDFIKTVCQYTSGASIIFIHSTVSVGTTKKLFDQLGNVVHSPVRGIHPNLREGLLTFTKYVGADDPDLGNRAVTHLQEIGIPATYVNSSKATELGKLLDTTYYGLCIAYHGYAKDLCEREGVNYDAVMTDFNRSYNEGYVRLGLSKVVRPILYPPNEQIGGHCVIPNANILKRAYGEDSILDAILEYS